MRLTYWLKFAKGDNKIRTEYRRDVLRYIKNSLSEYAPEIYEKYYANKKENQPKPFTFSVSFSIAEKPNSRNDYFILENDSLKIHFSFADYTFGMTVYNALLQEKNEAKIFGDAVQKIEHINLEKDKKIDDSTTVFKTLSPILVRDLHNGKGKGFIDSNHKNFSGNLTKNITHLANHFLQETNISENEISVEPVKMKSDIINHYGGEIGNTGIIKISAPGEILQLIYDAGLGAKRSQGFGMLEVIG
ncbi:CRISPR-associated protein Cas6 [Flexistipes sinusarabici DSM 4947]|uniref:CRISPR-associated protein Cas6 n=1 Tax=Flexistipes sinusarabici (strain ATCC 49648 / DSM 4947 / MAS 10) TaxID=717231 RepID=F8E5C0_FLESM|nr:CRISPR-associated endoribonuclease Cas6 [Flexistipes sinusarabici]AEI14616.1 CRISPR-associated protein Cas6 [Flexistipes sinusarabici DSM 4947]